MATRRSTTTYAVSGILLLAAAYGAYPLFMNQSLKGFTNPVPTIVVMQEKPNGKSGLSVNVVIESRKDAAVLRLEEIDLADSSVKGATTYIGIERWNEDEGYSFSYEPLACTADARGASPTAISEVGPTPVLEKAVADGKITAVPTATGTITAVRLKRSAEQFTIECELPQFGFTRQSLDNWNLYLPGVETYGIATAQDPTIGYWITRDPADYIVGTSQQPSEILGDQYAWYERHFEALARQGLWLTVSSPALQQESAYRLFVAGALLGLAGGLLVAAVQSVVERRSADA